MTGDDQNGVPGVEVASVLAALDEPAFVLADGTLQQCNHAARSLFGEDLVGTAVTDAFEPHPDLLAAIESGGLSTVRTDVGGETSHLDVRTAELDSSADGERRLVRCRDVTEREQLAQQVDQLEQFASLMSHDLRNPLDVAIGRTNAVKEMLDDPELEGHLGGAQDAHERMERLIDEALKLARHGKEIGEPSHVALETIAADAWSHVDTGDATLDAETQLVVAADRSRLSHLLENLFRNAIEHAGRDVTVTIGTLPDESGFYLADDGPGIPPEQQAAIFETGYSDGGGTGLGLAITASITEAHGWEVSVCDADSGGARFEFTGVDTVDPSLAEPDAE